MLNIYQSGFFCCKKEMLRTNKIKKGFKHVQTNNK